MEKMTDDIYLKMQAMVGSGQKNRESPAREKISFPWPSDVKIHAHMQGDAAKMIPKMDDQLDLRQTAKRSRINIEVIGRHVLRNRKVDGKVFAVEIYVRNGKPDEPPVKSFRVYAPQDVRRVVREANEYRMELNKLYAN